MAIHSAAAREGLRDELDAHHYPPFPCERCGGALDVLGLIAGETPATQYENVRCRDCGAGGTLVRRVEDWGIDRRVGPAVRHSPPGARRSANATAPDGPTQSLSRRP